jgi:GNAT superfamily N-acetyltransferase
MHASKPADVERAVAVLVTAFVNDPFMRWLFPDPEQYLRHFPLFVRIFGGKAFQNNSAYLIPGGIGSALWLRSEIHSEEAAVAEFVEALLPANVPAEVYQIAEQMARCHPAEPHWYLTLMGIDGFCQRRGHGAALLKYGLDRCDEDHLPAYLEASPASIALYRQHGFELLAEIQVGSAPPFFPMFRAAR